MAQQYISSKNQELLWNTYIRIPVTQQLSNDEQTSIFRESVKNIYSTISKSNSMYLSSNELQQLNRKTMQSLLSSTKEQIAQSSSSISYPIQFSQNPTNSSDIHHLQQQSQDFSSSITKLPPTPGPQLQEQSHSSYVVETSEERMKRIFEEKQKQFQSFYEKPKLPDPKSMFEESVQDDDGVIQNVDELIEQYQQERNRDISVNPILLPQSSQNNIETVIANTATRNSEENRKELEQKLESLENRIIQLEEFIKDNLVLENIS
tara:strand:+ start:1021 stop:1809 length:789 start_codon:yes stop_codon:yes gene_type:complete